MQKLIKQCVGIDVSKLNLSVCVCQLEMDQGVRFSSVEEFSNDKQGFNKLTKWVGKQLEKGVPVVYLMEATGVYYESLAYHLDRIKKTVHVVLPNKAKHYLASLNYKTKTDAVDAKGLAQFGVERKFGLWQPPREIYRRFKELARHRTSLQDTKIMLMNQLSSFNSKEQGTGFIIKSLERMIDKVIGEVKKCEEELKGLIESDQELCQKMKCLTSITGVGLISASVIVAETGGFEHFKSIKQLVSFAGMDVVQRQSGTSVKGKTRISKKGNAHIRRAIYFPAVSAIQHSDTFKGIYARHLANKKPKMVALVAVQRKILALMFTLWKNESHFIENYQQQQAINKIAPAQAEATQDSVS